MGKNDLELLEEPQDTAFELVAALARLSTRSPLQSIETCAADAQNFRGSGKVPRHAKYTGDVLMLSFRQSRWLPIVAWRGFAEDGLLDVRREV